MKNALYLILGIVFLGTSVTFFLRSSVPVSRNPEAIQNIVKISHVETAVEIADSPEERARGLSGRTSLEKGRGMLFIFDEPGIYSFWMKEMNFPIDIVWIDVNFYIVDIHRNVSPDTFPERFSPSSPAKYVLEMPAGSADEFDIGHVVSLE